MNKTIDMRLNTCRLRILVSLRDVMDLEDLMKTQYIFSFYRPVGTFVLIL